MKKTLTILLFPALMFSASAQISLNNLFTSEASGTLCQPGVVNKSPGKGASFTYSLNPDFKMTVPDAENASKIERSERFDSKLKLPLINAPGFKFMLGFQYTLEKYHFSDIDPENAPLFSRLNNAELKTTGVAAYIVHPINEKIYTSFRFGASWHGDYSTFISLDNRFAIYRAAALIGIKKRDNLEYGIGLLFIKSFRRTSILPFGFYNQTFNEHWGIEMVLPVSIKGRYNFNEHSMALFGAEYSSQDYALKVPQPSMNPFLPQPLKAPFHYHRSSIDLTTSFYQRLTSWTWVELKAGYAFSLSSKAKDIPLNQTFDLKPSSGMVGMVSLFLSPPKNCMEH